MAEVVQNLDLAFESLEWLNPESIVVEPCLESENSVLVAALKVSLICEPNILARDYLRPKFDNEAKTYKLRLFSTTT